MPVEPGRTDDDRRDHRHGATVASLAAPGLILIAVLEFLDALSGVQNIFTDYHHPTTFLRFAQTLTSIKLALAPVLAGAALVYAGWGNLRAHLRSPRSRS